MDEIEKEKGPGRLDEPITKTFSSSQVKIDPYIEAESWESTGSNKTDLPRGEPSEGEPKLTHDDLFNSDFFRDLMQEKSISPSFPKRKFGRKPKGFGDGHRTDPDTDPLGDVEEKSDSIPFWRKRFESDQNILISTSKSHYFCIDIDKPAFTEPILRIIRDQRINCFFVQTPRGGCHLVLKKDTYIRDTSDRKTQIFLFGLKIELFAQQDVVLFGPSYRIRYLPQGDLSVLPANLRFIKLRKLDRWNATLPLVDSLIMESTRNTTLYEWARVVRSKSPQFPITREEFRGILYLMSQYFCEPPYPDNVDHLVDLVFSRKDGSSMGEDDKMRLAHESFSRNNLGDLVETLSSTLQDRLTFHEERKTWFYCSSETNVWANLTVHNLRLLLIEKILELTETRPPVRVVKIIIEELEVYLLFKKESFYEVNSLSFKNGWLNLEDGSFNPHSEKRFCTEVIPVDYDSEAVVSEFFRNVFENWVNGDKNALNHLRAFLARALLKPTGFRGILLLTGPPKTGKSTFITFLAKIFLDQLTSFVYRKENAFDRRAWRDARVLVLNDCGEIRPHERDILRQLSGNDPISYEEKYETHTAGQTYQFRGIIIIVSNRPKSDLLGKEGDPALNQRILEIYFPNPLKAGQGNISLGTELIKEIPGAVNWALKVHPEVLQAQATAERIDDCWSITSEFIITNLARAEGNLLSNQDIKIAFSLFLESNDIPAAEVKGDLLTNIVNECSSLFGWAVYRKRTSSTRGLVNIKMLPLTSGPDFILERPLSFYHLNPWYQNIFLNIPAIDAKFRDEVIQSNKDIREDREKKEKGQDESAINPGSQSLSDPGIVGTTEGSLREKAEKAIDGEEASVAKPDPLPILRPDPAGSSGVHMDIIPTSQEGNTSVEEPSKRVPTKVAASKLSQSKKTPRKKTPPKVKDPIDNSKRVNKDKVDDKINEFVEEVCTKHPEILGPLELLEELDDAFSIAMIRLHQFIQLPRVGYKLDPFTPNPDTEDFHRFQTQVFEMPHNCWPEILEIFEKILPASTRTLLYEMIQLYMPLKSGSESGWFANRRKSGVCTQLFPPAYRTGDAYDRLFPKVLNDLPVLNKDNKQCWKPISVLYGTHRNYKIFIIRILNRLMKEKAIPFRFLEVDIASCHARVVASLFKEETPTLNRVFREEANLWGTIIEGLPQEIVQLIQTHTPVKGIVKIVAYKILQTGLLKFDSIHSAIKEYLFNLSPGEQVQVVNAFLNNGPIREFRALFDAVEKKISYGTAIVYSPVSRDSLSFDSKLGQDKKLTALGVTNNKFRMCSSALVSIESLVLMMIIQVFIEKGEVIPISLEHDGCLCLVREKENSFHVEEYDEYLWNHYVKDANLHKMTLEVKTL